MAAGNHSLFKYSLSDLCKRYSTAHEYLCIHDRHLCRIYHIFSPYVFHHKQGRKHSGRIQIFKLGNNHPFGLGFVIVGLEVGFIYAYKAGWKVSILATVTNAFLAIGLLLLGYFMYHEVIGWSKILGVAICLAGLWFINR